MTSPHPATHPSPVVALLGTGAMGLGMGRSLARAGLTVRAWNRSPERARPLADDGVRIAADPAEAVAGAGVVVTMLFDTDSVAATIEQAAPALAEGTIWLQTSTVGVAGTERLAELAERLGLVFVDAPVLGTTGPAEQGTLTVLASGPRTARTALAPVLEAIGSRTLWVGPAGAGSRLKLVCNGWVLTLVDGVAQALRTAEAFGLDPALFIEAVRGSAVDAGYVALKGEAMLAENWQPGFALSGALKDATLIETDARAAGADPAFVALVREHLRSAEQAGHGDKDMAALHLVLGQATENAPERP